MSLGTISKEIWADHIGEQFQVYGDNASTMPMKLVSVSGYGRRMGGDREAYSLVFCGSLQPVFPQRIYRISHPVIGELELFLVPIGPQADGMGYEAVFT